MTTQPPTPTEWHYRGHYIAQVPSGWVVTDDHVAGCVVFEGETLAQCFVAVDQLIGYTPTEEPTQ